MRQHDFKRGLHGFGLFAFFALAASGLGACQTIAGIEDRKLDPSLEHVSSKQCQDYCTTVMTNCVKANAVYPSVEQCLAVCAYLDPGTDDVELVDSNTVSCRARYAENANKEPDSDCKYAGPGGGGQCGTDCDAYCTLFPQICPKNYGYQSTGDCLNACKALKDQDRFNLKLDHSGDTIECRLVHTSSASLLPDDHCPHAPIAPTAPWCIDDVTAAPTCEAYCQAELAACTGDLAQYASPKQCLNTCQALDPGTNADIKENTVGCRRYHSFNATLLPASHCPHSGPSGDGHCAGTPATGNCESYCKLLAAACPDEFDASLGSSKACMTACADLPESAADSKYTLASAKKSKGLQCRILHAVEAFEDKTACASALGGDQCQ